MKKLVAALGLLLLSACYTVPDQGDLDDATVYHWENEFITMEQFVRDHKACLGVQKTRRRNSFENLLYGHEPEVVPRWDSLWATFESRGFQEAGQRVMFSIPAGQGDVKLHNYRACMIGRGYRLAFLR
ncbi:MAG: hypothetical protein FWD15_01660 [Alphaproteobacteria bacterium]|nr:hypothetical protein [Alphaproteobacteria bacterium]